MSERLFVGFAVALFSFGSASCGHVASWITREPASWRYVEEAWGGMQVSEAHIHEGRLSFQIRLGVHPSTRMDSAICVGRVRSRVDSSGRILIALDKSLCDGPVFKSPYSASLALPGQGTYEVVYDDEAAGFPKLGQIQVP